MTASTYIDTDLFPEIPSTQTLDRKETPLESFKHFLAINEQEGGLIYPSQAAYLCGVSRQCISDYVSRGRLHTWTFFGSPYLSANEVTALYEIIDTKRKVKGTGGRGKKLGYVGMAKATIQGIKEK